MIIAIEGVDGSGKGTQSALLCARLKQQGFQVELLSFPRYMETFFGRECGNYLNGLFGRLENVHPKMAAILFAADRFESISILKKYARNKDNILICDRYVASNIAYQASRAPEENFETMSRWILELEYDVFNIPRPDLAIMLDIETAISRQLISRKSAREYTSLKFDIHEDDHQYQSAISKLYKLLSKDEGWHIIDCQINGVIRAAEDIHEDVLSAVIHHINQYI